MAGGRDEQAAVDAEPFAAALARIVRGGWDELSSSFIELGDPLTLDETRTTVRCHLVRSDPNGKARTEAIARQLADQIVHYCIPRTEITRVQSLPGDRQVQAISRLTRDARKLFTRTQLKTGEAAELMLYALLEKQLKIPQILSKMSLKTSTEVQYQGADGVHARLLENGDLAVYWGEAKLYESVSEAMSDCLDSLAPYLQRSAWEQDVFLIRHFADTGVGTLTTRLLEYFDDGSPLSAQVDMRGACLIGFTHDNYPQLPSQFEEVREEIEASLESWRRGMKTRVNYRKLQQFEIEVFFIPVPDAQTLRDAVKRELAIPVIAANE